MNTELESIAIKHGDRLKVIPVKHLAELKEIIDKFKEQEELNNFQKWIINDLYHFSVPKLDFPVNSVLLIAVHHPFYAEVEFQKDGKKYKALSLVKPDLDDVESYITEYMKKSGYSFQAEYNLPMKRLAAHSGLAMYGRNNITYIDGMGSNFTYAAYYTDMPCEDDTWGEMNNAKICEKCHACINSCPTKAIREDRFLIDNSICLSCLNEMPNKFPKWLPNSIHHTIYDCLICQRVCPMNADQSKQILKGITFDEKETSMLLAGRPLKEFSEESIEKIKLLEINKWYAAIPRNLSILFENQDSQLIS